MRYPADHKQQTRERIVRARAFTDERDRQRILEGARRFFLVAAER